ncbi:MATE family efflux transporter [Zoogloea sp.]|uniref:MATE family efflux transporter n=1 Tax=Zoogloea sp. TaxID=49181 RepID=UPI00261A8A23|nr:MATE family efflux transporter [uncultured Zoogloea sp.]
MSPESSSLTRRIVELAWPVLIAQLSSMTQMVSDTVLAGRYGTEDLAAVAVASGIYISVVMLMVGILQAVAPTVAHHVGAGRRDEIGPSVQQGFWLALGLALPAVLFLRQPDWLMQLSHMSPGVESRARDYLGTIAWGLPAALLYRTFYAFTNALGRTRVLMFISLAATAVHIPLSWALINGHLGMAAMGGAGCAVSSACIAWLSLAAALVHVLREPAYAPYRLFSRWQPPRARAIGELLRLGLPMGFSSFVEITAFTLIALLVAGLGADVVAGHRIVGNLSALIYMLPLAIAIATLVLVGRAVGARDGHGARRAAKVGIGLATGLSTLVSLAVWLFREPILAAYTADPAVLGLAVSLVVYICLYQFFDAIQTVAAHALRGYKITFGPMLVHTFCFWGIGLAGGYGLAFHGLGALPPQGVAGFWQAAVASNVVASVLFAAYLQVVSRATAEPAP